MADRAETRYRYTNLSAALRDRRSPLRGYLDRTFPAVRAVQADYRSRIGPIVVPSAGASPALVGVAFDLGVRIRLEPDRVPEIATIAFSAMPHRQAVIRRIGDDAGRCVRTGDVEGFARACWALALCVQVYRDGGIGPDSALYRLVRADRFTVPDLESVASGAAVTELVRLDELARGRLVPHLRRPWHLGPTFDASALCAADADLIADHLLIDIKTRLGPADPRTGIRSDRLPSADIRQLVSYALFDTSDRYGVRAIGIYSARYGELVTWPLGEILDLLAGRPVDLPRERAEIRRLLGG